MNIACVLRKSADFNESHVVWLKSQCERYIRHDEFICYDDSLLSTSWPKWWAKMELYRDLCGSVLILDLDTVIIAPFVVSEEHLKDNWVMRHFTRDGFRAPEEFACGIMLTTEDFRKRVYTHFSERPDFYMREAGWDDQKYFKKYWDTELKRFQDEFPDQFVSYKLHVLQNGLQDDAVFVNFHGKPRPWDISEEWIPKCLPQDQSSAQAA